MAGNVGKSLGRGLAADAVDTEMAGFKDNRFLAGIVAGFGDPLHLARIVHIDCIQISGAFSLCWGIRQMHRDGMSIQAGNRCFFATGEVHQRQIIGRSCADGCLGLGGMQRIHPVYPELPELPELPSDEPPEEEPPPLLEGRLETVSVPGTYVIS